MKIFEIVHFTSNGVDAVTMIRANNKKEALKKLRGLVNNGWYIKCTAFYPDETQSLNFVFKGQKPVMNSIEILDQSKETVFC